MALTKPKLYQFDTSITAFSDPITVLHQGASSANVDVGFLFNRANGLVSNVALVWSESAQSIVTAFTSNTGGTDSNIAISSYANLTVGNLLLVQGSLLGVVGNLTVGNLTANTSVYASNYFYSNGTQFSSSSYGNATVAAYLPGYTGNIGAGNITTTGTVAVGNGTVPSTSTSTGALVVSGGAGISGNLNVGGNLTVSGNVTSVNYETVIYTETANVLVANTLTVANVTITGTISNAVFPLLLNDIGNQFNANTAVFALRNGQTAITGIVDNKDLTVSIDGRALSPYVTELRYPWITPYDSYRGFRVVKNSGNARISTSNTAQFLIIYNAPDIGQQATVTQVNTSTAKQTRRYPFSAATIALGD